MVNLDELPRPDLGRKRIDGVFAGGLRLLLTDGHPTIIEDEESRYFQDSEEMTYLCQPADIA